MFLSLPTTEPDAFEDLVYDDDNTYSPADAHPVAKAAADARGAAARNREYRAREKVRATLDLVLVDAMVSQQLHARDEIRIRTGCTSTLPPQLMLAQVVRLAFRELLLRGWTKQKANDALSARLNVRVPPIPAA